MVLRAKPAEAGREDHFDDRRMEVIMGRLLQVGVLLASFVMLAGGLLYLRAHHAGIPDYRVFKSEPQALRHVGGVSERRREWAIRRPSFNLRCCC